ncbi:hypothetical protein C0J52_18072 [Blattella germanica]|nr:hypothetical protein C0J52_18072 [Blattella germanica]
MGIESSSEEEDYGEGQEEQSLIKERRSQFPIGTRRRKISRKALGGIFLEASLDSNLRNRFPLQHLLFELILSSNIPLIFIKSIDNNFQTDNISSKLMSFDFSGIKSCLTASASNNISSGKQIRKGEREDDRCCKHQRVSSANHFKASCGWLSATANAGFNANLDKSVKS